MIQKVHQGSSLIQKRCAFPNCIELVPRKICFCPDHERSQPPTKDNRPNANSRGYNSKWRRVRSRFLKAHPLCEECLKLGLTEPATTVHHIRPVSRGGKHVSNNLVSLCVSHHAKVEAQVNQKKENRPSDYVTGG